MMVLWVLVLGILMVILLTMLLNSITFPRLNAAPASADKPFVSLLVPARDEAAVIGETVRSC